MAVVRTASHVVRSNGGTAPERAADPLGPATQLVFLLQATAVAGFGGLIGYLGWDSLAVPTRELTVFVSDAISVDPARTDRSRCAADGSIEAISCFAQSAGWSLLGVVVVIGALVSVRAPLMAIFRRIVNLLPTLVGPVLTALLATTVFAMSYANIHSQPGLLADGFIAIELFPAVVGLATFLITSLASSHSALISAIFRTRDLIPTFIRVVVVVAVPILASLLIADDLAGLSSIAQEQVVITASTVVGAIAFVPSIHKPASPR